MTPNTQEHQFDWEFILQTMQEGQCVFLLGPGMSRLEANKERFFASFVESLDVVNNPRIASFYERDEFFLFANPARQNKTPIFYKLKAFYQEKTYWKAPYDLIAKLPVKLVLNTGPDVFLQKQFEAADRQMAFSFFDRSQAKPELPYFGKDKPLLYNLMGKVDEEESLILTHEDLFEYLEAVLARAELPDALIEKLFDARCFVFLGFNFDQWYVQILLRLLRLHKVPGLRLATEQKFNADTLSICQDQFHIEFVGQEVSEFLEVLIEKAEAKDMLWQADARSQGVSEEAKFLLSQSQILEGLNLLLDFFEKHDQSLANECRATLSRYNRLQGRIREKMLTDEQAEVRLNEITKAVEYLIEETEIIEQAGN